MNATSFTIVGLARKAIRGMQAGGVAARLKIDAAMKRFRAAPLPRVR